MSKTVVLITGANTGIGYETVKALLQSGKPYHILLGSRSVDKGTAAAEALKKEVPEAGGSVVDVVQIDIASDESIGAAFEKVKAGPGYIDVLVNNAGR
jgi:NAD(P)-dependent dehydrogenase (short-subunit alcohol dehydrogenase family)